MPDEQINELKPQILNNKIVEFRKIVEKSAIRCIRHNVQAVKKLRDKKGNEQQVEKNRRKVERLVAEMEHFKKLDADSVTKFALVNTKSQDELLKNETSDPSKRTMYKVACCELMASHVDKFRQQYPLWPVEVPFMLQRLGLQYRSKNKKNSVKNQIIPNIIGKKASVKEDKVQNEIAENRDDNERPQNVSLLDVEDKNVKKLTANPAKNVKQKVAIKKSKTSTKRADVATTSKVSDSSKSADLPIKEGRSGIMEVRRLKLNDVASEEDIIFTDVADSTPKKHLTSTHDVDYLQNDPFFDTATGNEKQKLFREDHGVSADFLVENEKAENLNSSKRRVTKKSLMSKFASSLARGNDAIEEDNTEKERSSEMMRFRRPRLTSKLNTGNANLIPLGKPKPAGENRKQRRLKMKQEEVKKIELASLHPSWQAKKKLNNPTLVPSSGKRIKFDD